MKAATQTLPSRSSRRDGPAAALGQGEVGDRAEIVVDGGGDSGLPDGPAGITGRRQKRQGEQTGKGTGHGNLTSLAATR